MKILAHKNINLHSASSKGKLIHIASKQVKIVPDDVVDHPAFDLLLDDGSIVVIKEEEINNVPEGIKELLEKYPDAANHIEEARISGSPLHLVEARIVADQEAEKNNVSKDEDFDEPKSDESKESDEESDSYDEKTDEESDDEEIDDEKSE